MGGRVVTVRHGQVQEEKNHTERYAGVPGMNAICKHLSRDVQVRYETRVDSLERDGRRWRLCQDDVSELGSFDAVIISVPAAQTSQLLRAAPGLARQANAVAMAGCWSVMAAFRQPLDLDFAGAFVQDSELAWIARNSSKPERPRHPDSWVLHATPEWTAEFMEDAAENVCRVLLDSFWAATGVNPSETEFCTAHRWRFALPTEPLATSCLFDPSLRLGACGDWCGGPRVEGAFLSGMAAAGRVLGLLNETPGATMPSVGQQAFLFDVG